MNNTPDTVSQSEISTPKLSRLDVFGRRINNMIAATALSLMAVLGACEDSKNVNPRKAAVERCSDPDYSAQFPIRQGIQIALAIHIVMNSDGTSNVDLDAIKEDIDDLRRVYRDIVEDIYVARVRRVHDSTLQPNVVPGESRDDYEARLKAYVNEYGTDGALDVMYIPGDLGGVGGTFLTTGGSEDFITVYTNQQGVAHRRQTLSHESGHWLGLPHPSDLEGDGIEDTMNYSVACGDVELTTTYFEGGICMVSCTNGSYADQVNVMDIFTCFDVNGNPVYAGEEGITLGQVTKANCVLHDGLEDHIDPELDRADF